MGNNTIFQVVLVSDGHLSFIMMNYGNLAPKTQSVQLNFTATWVFIATWDNVAFYNMDTAGFVTADSMIYFNILEQTLSTDLTFSSNINDR
ncbi:hypothetical protein Z043_125782, partial [Scleropages formosus]